MSKRGKRLLQAGSVLALLMVLAGCTKGGQFDPTTIFDNSMFDTKKKLKGERVPVFPDGVPGATTGVPPDLVKGYQPPPDQPDPDSINPPPAAPAPAKAAEAKPKPKPRPKPKVATKQNDDSIWNKKPSGPTHISVGSKPSAPAQQPAPAQSSQQPPAFAWPAPPQSAPAQPSAQQSQSVWPNPPAPATPSQ